MVRRSVLVSFLDNGLDWAKQKVAISDSGEMGRGMVVTTDVLPDKLKEVIFPHIRGNPQYRLRLGPTPIGKKTMAFTIMKKINWWKFL